MIAAMCRVIAVVFLAAAATLTVSSSLDAGTFEFRGEVSGVIEGDAIRVALDNGKSERVRLIGIDAPERGTCYAAKARARLAQIVRGKRVALVGDPALDSLDRYRRRLAYVWAGGMDSGQQLILGGYAKVYAHDRAFRRLSVYERAEASASRADRGLWSACRKKPKPPPSNCDPSYPDVCIPPYPPDLDCADVPYTNFRVIGDDPHGFDGDGDGYGCED
jgi:micrococcal nuclease